MITSASRALLPMVLGLSAAAMVLHSAPARAQAAAPAAQVGGAWNTQWGGGAAVLHLVQKGNQVSGTYTGTNEGKVAGTLAGKVLTGSWRGMAPGDMGGFVLDFSADGRSFKGTWGAGSSRTDGGPWVGSRK